MFFIFAPQIFRVRHSRSRHTLTCGAKSRASAGTNKSADRDPLPLHPDRQKHSRSRRRSTNAEHIRKRDKSSDIWNTTIDDSTPPETIIHQSCHTPPIDTSTLESQARMAARSSKDPKPEQNPSADTENAPKKKRGRPKGSKSVNQSSMPEPKISPFMLAVREDIRRRSIAANRDIVSGLFDFQSDDPVKRDDVQLSAPNGLPDGDDNTDLLQELLPILAQQENEKRRLVTEEEDRMNQLVSTCYTQFSSIHRFGDRLDNLKPYKLQEDSEKECQACGGAGMTVCEYCKGEGFVDLGENGEKFNPNFGGNVFTMPKRVTGNIYHCPLCGGLQEERCISCLGTGVIRDASNVTKGGSKQGKEERAWKVFDMKELIEQEKDRIEIGLDGTIILRAKRRGRRKKSTAIADEPKRQKRRGRPPKSASKGDTPEGKWDDGGAESATVANNDADLTSDLQGLEGDTSNPLTVDSSPTSNQTMTPPAPAVVIAPGRPVGRTTDFVNTTDYQVGRRLRRQYRNIGRLFQDPSEDSIDSVDSALPRSDQGDAEA